MSKSTVFKACMSSADFKALWEQAKDSNARLRTCSRHRFPSLVSEWPKKYRCEVCGGEADAEYVMTYCAGFRAAGGDPRIVCSNIDGEAA